MLCRCRCAVLAYSSLPESSIPPTSLLQGAEDVCDGRSSMDTAPTYMKFLFGDADDRRSDHALRAVLSQRSRRQARGGGKGRSEHHAL